jgi:hypothetical protein
VGTADLLSFLWGIEHCNGIDLNFIQPDRRINLGWHYFKDNIPSVISLRQKYTSTRTYSRVPSGKTDLKQKTFLKIEYLKSHNVYIRGSFKKYVDNVAPLQIICQNIIFCKNIYCMNVWIFIAIGQMDLILIKFKTNMFCTHGAVVTSET